MGNKAQTVKPDESVCPDEPVGKGNRGKQGQGTEINGLPEEVKASRFTPDRINRLREKLGISQRELGALVGATIGAVLSWEKGKFKPQGEKKAALVALRKVRKRDVQKMLAEKDGEKNRDRKGHPTGGVMHESRGRNLPLKLSRSRIAEAALL